MNKAALVKHEIYNKLVGFTDQDLIDIVSFIDFMRYKKNLGAKKMVKLEGILKGHDVDFTDLKILKRQTWRHVEEELDNG
ncbi:hypothetical protein VU01_12403 [Candidatus Electrothrix marina]|uniref:Uncharacterized protein n=1 Tax=Candidatus Electrothrix marina TaxID=1859130 RepID=A0A444JCZ2_9BACT|nr:hypothetical protein VU01_12403 [Candidatus Electrothrix marina]